MKKGLSTLDFVNKSVLVVALIFIVVFAVLMLSSMEDTPVYYVALFSIFTLAVPPLGRDVTLMPVKREVAYKAQLRATKLVVVVYTVASLMIMVLMKVAFDSEIHYTNIFFGVEIAFLGIMCGMYLSHLFRRIMTVRNKIINVLLGMILFVLSIAAITFVLYFSTACIRSLTQVHYVFPTIGLICSILLFVFIDKYNYKVNIKLIKQCDFMTGDSASAINLSKEYYKQTKYCREFKQEVDLEKEGQK